MMASESSPQPSPANAGEEQAELAGALEVAAARGMIAEAAGPALKREVRRAVSEGAAFDAPFVLSNLAATVIASAGLINDSAATIIGAMLVATLMGPIMGLGLALVEFDNRLLRRALVALCGGTALVLAAAVAAGLLAPDVSATSEMLSRTSPRFADLIVAFASGAICAYASTVTRLSAAIVGVSIAVALVPPLATAGLFAARGEWSPAGGALLLAFVNIVAIQVSTSLVFWLRGFRGRVRIGGKAQLRQQAVSLVLMTALASRTDASLSELTFTRRQGRTVATAVVRSAARFTQAEVSAMARRLPASPDGSPVRLTLRHVEVQVLSDFE